ncbi:hypothetical protein B9Z55_022202 [Caenorhabditis nigoni]|uniref:Uncharacterized protein n=1 Tax=Caenorhabditis nigoni TaxID=1611254 RepID=A0A2G5SJL1_9PELO|nr:hypothetical protein B9Z55_022202 [Caenorhabditis nigoni]
MVEDVQYWTRGRAKRMNMGDGRKKQVKPYHSINSMKLSSKYLISFIRSSHVITKAELFIEQLVDNQVCCAEKVL